MNTNHTKSTLLLLPQSLLNSWYTVLIRIYKNSKVIIKDLEIIQILFFLTCLLLMLSATPHWLGYSVSFKQTEAFTIGSDMRLSFFSAGLIGIFLFFFRLTYQRIIYYTIITIVTCIYIIGLYSPSWIHTDMSNNADYYFQSVWVYFYGAGLILAILTTYRGLENPLLSKSNISNWLFSIKSYSDPKDSTSKQNK